LKIVHPPFQRETLDWKELSSILPKLWIRSLIGSGAKKKRLANNNGPIKRYFLFQTNNRNIPPIKKPSQACLVKVISRQRSKTPILTNTQVFLGLEKKYQLKTTKLISIKPPAKVAGVLLVPMGLTQDVPKELT
jgi:hypothetical protein